MADDNSTTATNTVTTVPASGTTTTFTPPAATTVAAQPAEPKKDDVPPEVKKALRDANKEAETLRLKLKEYEDRDKTEQQKLLERAETAEREREALLTEALRVRVALTKGVPAELADRLRGSTEEELSADADALLALVTPGTARPRGDVDQGARAAFTHLNDGDGLERAIRQKVFGS